MYKNVHPKLALVPLFKRTEVECGKGLLPIFCLVDGDLSTKINGQVIVLAGRV